MLAVRSNLWHKKSVQRMQKYMWKLINIKESLRFSQRAHYRMDARSKYKTSRVIWRSLSCGLTRRGVIVAEKGSSGRSRWHGGKSKDLQRSCTKWRKARSEKRNVKMSCDAFVIERAIYLPHRPPTDNFLKPLACTNSTPTIYYASKFLQSRYSNITLRTCTKYISYDRD